MFRVALLAVMALLACCSSPSVPEGITFPRYSATDHQPTAEIDARLIRVGSCLGLESGDVVYVALWPAAYGASLSDTGRLVVTRDDRALASEGADASFGGGEYSNARKDLVEDLVGQLPSGCEADGYWLVTGIQ